MSGAVRYCLEREPDFFALTRLQGESAEVALVEDDGGNAVAMGTAASVVRTLAGAPRRLFYLADLKVDPAHRGEGHAGRLIDHAAAAMASGGAEGAYGIVLGGNRAMRPVVENEGARLRIRRVAELECHALFLGPRPARPERIAVRHACAADAPAMIELWNRHAAGRELAPVWDAGSLAATCLRTPGLRLESFLVAERAGRVTGVAVAWDPRPVRQIRLLGLGGAASLARRAHDLLGAACGRRPLPRDGDVLPVLHLAHVAADTPLDLRALVVAAMREHAVGSHALMDVVLDRRDPLAAGLRHLYGTRVRYDLVLAHTAGQRPLEPSVRPFAFEMALA